MYMTDLLLKSGIKGSGIVAVHCDLEKFKVETESLLEGLASVAESGILVMPSGENKRSANAVFDPAETPSGHGELSEKFRKYPGVIRSLHPSDSLAALGNGAEALLAGHEKCSSAYSPASPWWKIFQHGGTILFMGCGLEKCLFFCAIEEWAGTAVLSKRTYCRRLALGNGKNRRIKVKFHTEKHFLKYPKVEAFLQENGALVKIPCEYGSLFSVDIRESGELLLALLKRKPWIFGIRRRGKNLKNESNHDILYVSNN